MMMMMMMMMMIRINDIWYIVGCKLYGQDTVYIYIYTVYVYTLHHFVIVVWKSIVPDLKLEFIFVYDSFEWSQTNIYIYIHIYIYIYTYTMLENLHSVVQDSSMS